MPDSNNSVRIVQVDGKDLYLTNTLLDEEKMGYRITNKYGIVNTKRFRANLDYSLELIQLRNVYKDVYGKDDFSFQIGCFDYTRHVCSVTFKFSVKEFNRLSSDTYIRYDVDSRKAEFKDCVWVEGGRLLGVQTGRKVNKAVDQSLLGKWFEIVDGEYVCTERFKTILNASKIREWVYKNGFYMDGIKFIRYKRSAGSARTGKCLFIDEKLYPAIHKWEMCGLEINEGEDCDLAGIESYISLTASSIIGAIKIKPENILLVDDYESVFKDSVVAVGAGTDGHLVAEEKEVEISNSIWDGESLIDKSLMGDYSPYGFVLLRNSFFKSAAFNCNLQKWFADNGITDVSQLNGKTYAKRIEDVLFVITPSSLKYLKYGTFENWLHNVSSVYGVVKHEKKPKFLGGKGVKVSYQLINTLAMTKSDVAEFLEPSLKYLDLIKRDIAAFRYHIHFKAQNEDDVSVKTRNDVIYRILGVSDEFTRTKLFQDFKKETVHAYISELKLGHIIVNGNNSVMAGNIMELLANTIGCFDGTSTLGVGNIHSRRFGYGTRLLGCRSPHTSSGNVLLAMNVEDKNIDKYFNLTTEIVVVNSINDNILQRLSGCDFDSDSVLLTDDKVLIRCAEKYYNTFKVPTMVMDSNKLKRKYTNVDKANLDRFCDNDNIGIIVNLSQEVNCKMWERINRFGDWDGAMKAYYDNCLLSILSGIAIDMTKREYAIDCMEELQLVRARYDDRDEDGKPIRPYFFAHVAKKKGYYSKKKNYKKHLAPMDFVQEIVDSKKNSGYKSRAVSGNKGLCSIGEIVEQLNPSEKARTGYVDLIISMVRDMDSRIRMIYQSHDSVVSGVEKRRLASNYFDRCIEGIKTMHVTNATMQELLVAMDCPENADIKRKLWTILFGAFGRELSSLLIESKTPINTIEECPAGENGDVSVFWLQFKYVSVA